MDQAPSTPVKKKQQQQQTEKKTRGRTRSRGEAEVDAESGDESEASSDEEEGESDDGTPKKKKTRKKTSTASPRKRARVAPSHNAGMDEEELARASRMMSSFAHTPEGDASGHPGKHKVRKKVTKTFQDEEGFLGEIGV